ncbi:MAG: OmpA family protein [Alphaproteobacteria bacterium]|nr:OmpA family protein [Alphaproteobacteria bacterium]
MRALLVIAMLAFAGAAQAQDAAGTADHPAVTRFPGSVIIWQDEQAYEPYAIATGPVTGYRQIDDWRETQGRTSRTYYELTGDFTHGEVHANYLMALRAEGFEILAEGLLSQSSQANEIGSRKWLDVYFRRNTLPPNGIRLMQGSSTSGGSGFVAGVKARAGGDIYIAVATTQYAQDTVAILIDVIEVAELEGGRVAIDADAIGEGIDEEGRVVLDGLFFDHDAATLTAESDAALEQIAAFLNARPDMRFHVVGHTDATGTLSYNQTLSGRRAEAVIHALVSRYGIDGSRLEGHGVGPLSPVFSNRTEAGRAENRRVELVEWP